MDTIQGCEFYANMRAFDSVYRYLKDNGCYETALILLEEHPTHHRIEHHCQMALVLKTGLKWGLNAGLWPTSEMSHLKNEQPGPFEFDLLGQV